MTNTDISQIIDQFKKEGILDANDYKKYAQLIRRNPRFQAYTPIGQTKEALQTIIAQRNTKLIGPLYPYIRSLSKSLRYHKWWEIKDRISKMIAPKNVEELLIIDEIAEILWDCEYLSDD